MLDLTDFQKTDINTQRLIYNLRQLHVSPYSYSNQCTGKYLSFFLFFFLSRFLTVHTVNTQAMANKHLQYWPTNLNIGHRRRYKCNKYLYKLKVWVRDSGTDGDVLEFWHADLLRRERYEWHFIILLKGGLRGVNCEESDG